MKSTYYIYTVSTEFLRRSFNIILLLAMLCLLPNICNALDPEEILVIANRDAHKSIDIAKYYMRKRKIPKDNLIMVRVTDKETCSRTDYQKKVASPVRRYLEQNDSKSHIRCLQLIPLCQCK